MDESSFPELVQHALGPLLEQHGLKPLRRAPEFVVFAGDRLRVTASLDLHGQVEVTVARRSQPTSGVFLYSGMVGRASVERLLELASEALVADPRILAGDDPYFAELAVTQAKWSDEMTAYYAGEGPQPRRGRLP